ncbi:hypothetical protein [Pseudoalteromonas pernae]|uniref:hypothetical protein n=1 Tax=Pseudoalteromonas pernae TaxID=3118054 RepID=UPI0032424048
MGKKYLLLMIISVVGVTAFTLFNEDTVPQTELLHPQLNQQAPYSDDASEIEEQPAEYIEENQAEIVPLSSVEITDESILYETGNVSGEFLERRTALWMKLLENDPNYALTLLRNEPLLIETMDSTTLNILFDQFGDALLVEPFFTEFYLKQTNKTTQAMMFENVFQLDPQAGAELGSLFQDQTLIDAVYLQLFSYYEANYSGTDLFVFISQQGNQELAELLAENMASYQFNDPLQSAQWIADNDYQGTFSNSLKVLVSQHIANLSVDEIELLYSSSNFQDTVKEAAIEKYSVNEHEYEDELVRVRGF